MSRYTRSLTATADFEFIVAPGAIPFSSEHGFACLKIAHSATLMTSGFAFSFYEDSQDVCKVSVSYVSGMPFLF